MNRAFINGKIYSGESIISNKAILTSGGIIVDVVDNIFDPGEYEIIDLKGLNIAPALIDLQIYGGNGQMFSSDPSVASLEATYEQCLEGGTAWFQATVATNSLEVMLKAFDAAKSYQSNNNSGLIGIHLEGPYINASKKGAHQEQFIRIPEVKEVELLLKQGEGVFTMMTLAPEKCDAKIIGMLKEAGVIISAGHSAARYETAKASFNQGITTATHLHNAMSPFKNREPGLTGAIFDSDIFCSIIPDGVHVDYTTLRISKKIMQERLFIITDAITASTGEGYDFIKLPDRFVTRDNILAGSCLSMMQAVRNCVCHAGLELEEALRMASTYPSRVMKKEFELGKIEKGYKASFVVFDNQLNIINSCKRHSE